VREGLERERERYIKITSMKTIGDAQGHLSNDYISSTFSTEYNNLIKSIMTFSTTLS
jgi:hypothetical protein